MGNCSLCECEDLSLNLQNSLKAELSNAPGVPKIRWEAETEGLPEPHELASLVYRVRKTQRPCKVEG